MFVCVVPPSAIPRQFRRPHTCLSGRRLLQSNQVHTRCGGFAIQLGKHTASSIRGVAQTQSVSWGGTGRGAPLAARPRPATGRPRPGLAKGLMAGWQGVAKTAGRWAWPCQDTCSSGPCATAGPDFNNVMVHVHGSDRLLVEDSRGTSSDTSSFPARVCKHIRDGRW